ncbi:redoxin family protein [Glycocaulis sp.]
MSIKPGERLPDATFMTMTAEGPAPVTTADLTAGKTVALFAVPGAFTPTCSARHLPGFVQKAGELKARGIDTIACTSVNDVFVMDAWGKDQGAGSDVVMLADGNGDFAEAVGLTMDGSKFGMGKRAQRFAMIIRDGVVEHVFVEEPGDFKVSSADYLLEKL